MADDAVIAALTDAIAALNRASEAHHDACDTCAGGPFADPCPEDDALLLLTRDAEAARTTAGYVAPEFDDYDDADYPPLPVLLDYRTDRATAATCERCQQHWDVIPAGAVWVGEFRDTSTHLIACEPCAAEAVANYRGYGTPEWEAAEREAEDFERHNPDLGGELRHVW